MKGLWLAAAAAVVLAGCAGTDEGGAPSALASGSPAAGRAPGAPTSAGDYAREAALSDMYEIQAGQLALTRGSSPAVKTFAQQMVTDHTASSNALKAALASANIPATPPASLDARRQGMLTALGSASGADFDRLYLQQQMAAHDEALSLHTTYAQGGDSPPLRTLAGQVAGKVQMHIDMLRQMASA